MPEQNFKKMNSATCTTKEIHERIEYIAQNYAKIDKDVDAPNAQSETRKLVRFISADQSETLSTRATQRWASALKEEEKNSEYDEIFKQYFDFLQLISFESGPVTNSNFITNLKAIQAAKRESGPIIHQIFQDTQKVE